MASPVDIANLALTQLGQPGIVTLTDDASRAVAINLVYGLVRDSVLRCHPWNFAQKRAQLSQLADAPAFGWSYQSQLPNDYIRLTRCELLSTDFRVEGRVVLSNTTPIKILYTARIEDSEQYDSLFIDCFATKLAMEICLEVTGSRELMQQLNVVYERKLSLATFQDSREAPDLALEPSQFIETRLADVPFRAISDSSL